MENKKERNKRKIKRKNQKMCVNIKQYHFQFQTLSCLIIQCDSSRCPQISNLD